MHYARLEDFDVIVHHLMSDTAKQPVPLATDTLLATLSLLLRVYILPDITDEISVMVKDMCDLYADEIIRRYPFSEGYIDFLYGAAALTRGGFGM